jgi:N-acetylmuramoyl-L-alanine amidase
LKKTLTSLLLTSSVFAAVPAWAVPPAQARGLDLPALVSVLDHGRRAELLLNKTPSRTFKKIQTIVLDPGHGGENQGAIGVCNVHEKFLTMELALELRDRLQRTYPGARIVMTRYWDTSVGLPERIDFANKIQADLFVSLHYNAATHDRALGFETYFLNTSEATPGEEEVKGKPIAAARLEVTGLEKDQTVPKVSRSSSELLADIQVDLHRQRQHQESAEFARLTNEALATRLTSINRGVKQANFAVLRGAAMPAIVVESGFVSHPKEGHAILTDGHRANIVDALVEAIESFDSLLDRRETSN